MVQHTRRAFLKAGATAAVASLTSAQMARASGLPGASVAITRALDQFGYGEVELLEGPMRRQFDVNHAFFLALNEDMLLKPFRERAGQPAPGDDMGGWYDTRRSLTLMGVSMALSRVIALDSICRGWRGPML